MVKELTILCPYCNAPYTAKMKGQFDYSCGSEWTGIYGEEINIKIFCSNCKKLVYTKDEYYGSGFDETDSTYTE